MLMVEARCEKKKDEGGKIAWRESLARGRIKRGQGQGEGGDKWSEEKSSRK